MKKASSKKEKKAVKEKIHFSEVYSIAFEPEYKALLRLLATTKVDESSGATKGTRDPAVSAYITKQFPQTESRHTIEILDHRPLRWYQEYQALLNNIKIVNSNLLKITTDIRRFSSFLIQHYPALLHNMQLSRPSSIPMPAGTSNQTSEDSSNMQITDAYFLDAYVKFVRNGVFKSQPMLDSLYQQQANIQKKLSPLLEQKKLLLREIKTAGYEIQHIEWLANQKNKNYFSPSFFPATLQLPFPFSGNILGELPPDPSHRGSPNLFEDPLEPVRPRDIGNTWNAT